MTTGLGLRLSDVDRLLTTVRGQTAGAVQDVKDAKVAGTQEVITTAALWGVALLLLWKALK